MTKNNIHIAGWLLAVALLVGGSAQFADAQETSLKIAVVDLEVVVGRSTPGQELQTTLEAFQQDLQREGEELTARARELQQRIAEGVNALSEDRLAELQKEFEDAQIALRRFRDDKQREGEKIQSDALAEIEEKLEPVFEQVRQEMGLDLIINRVPGVVLMASERVDITELMIERFNAAYATPEPEQE